MAGWDLDESEIELLNIWLSFRPHDETSILKPSTCATISTTADALISHLTAPSGAHRIEFDDYPNRCIRLLHALVEFCCLHPRSMDWGIHVLFQIIKNVPTSAIGALGEGPEDFRLDLERYFGNFVDPYDSDGSRNPIGTKSTYVYDKTQLSVQFCSEEVEECPDKVIEMIQRIRKNRWRSMVAVCITARCHVLEQLVHPYNGSMDKTLMGFLKMGLDLKREWWNKVDCVGMVIMLRGSAAYLLSTFPLEERDVKRQEWMEALRILIYTIGEGRKIGDKADDFRIKYHAALALKNLRSGGENESSAGLFATEGWMF